MPTRPSGNYSPWGPPVSQVDVRRASGSSLTLSVTRSASSLVAPAQAEAGPCAPWPAPVPRSITASRTALPVWPVAPHQDRAVLLIHCHHPLARAAPVAPQLHPAETAADPR